jgi:putative ABC transport system permease protein
MLRSYFTIALRHLIRDRLHSFIMISGLVVGMTCAILIGLFSRHEQSFDRFGQNADQIYRITLQRLQPDGSVNTTTGRIGYGPGVGLVSDFPELTWSRFHVQKEVLLTPSTSAFQWLFYAEPTFLDIFGFRLLKGDPETALQSPLSIVLTERIAKFYFGDEDPMGRSIGWKNETYTVTGLLEDPPVTTHLNFDVLVSYATHVSKNPKPHWHDSRHAVYVRLPEGYSAQRLLDQLPSFVGRHAAEFSSGKDDPSQFRLGLQRLTDIHLNPYPIVSLFAETERQGDGRSLWIYGSIAALILTIACVNFINLSTARFGNRIREIGMRKVSGAARGSLIGQFLGESTLLAFAALPIAYTLAQWLLPTFATLVGSTAGDLSGIDTWEVLGLVSIAVVVGFIAGVYPACYLSGFSITHALKGRTDAAGSGQMLRNVLVVFQFATAIVLIVSAVVMRDQMAYFQTRDLGFDKDQVILIQGHWFSNFRYTRLRDRYLQNPNVLGVTISAEAPSIGGGDGRREVVRVGYEAQELEIPLFLAEVRDGFPATYGIDILAGRDFLPEIASDSTAATIINRTALAALGVQRPEDAIGLPIVYRNRSTQIIGVVDDFHFGSLHKRIPPTFLTYLPNPAIFFTFLAVRVSKDDIPETIAFLESSFGELMDNRPFTYSFLDEAFERLYRDESRQSETFSIFSGIAIFLSCWGLLGLIAFAVERRKKEIGTRKVCGATVSNILTLLSKDYLLLAALANAVAWPIAYQLMESWLSNFAYRIDLGISMFVIGGGIALSVLITTVASQVVRAATTNPIEALRAE